jgi:fused-like protein
MSLIKLIVKDPVRYPENMSPKFKDFLKGLLNKDPYKRLNWPKLLEHPFIQETEDERAERKKRSERYNQWIGLNFDLILQQGGSLTSTKQGDHSSNITNTKHQPTSVRANISDPLLFDMFSAEFEGLDTSATGVWVDWLKSAKDPTKTEQLRKNTKLLDLILKTVQQNIIDLQSTDKIPFLVCLRIISLLVTSVDPDFNSQVDILKNKLIPTSLISKLKVLSKDKAPSDSTCQLCSAILATLGLVSRAVYNKSEGINEIFVQSKLHQLIFRLDADFPSIDRIEPTQDRSCE